jgi:hypothetical protein
MTSWVSEKEATTTVSRAILRRVGASVGLSVVVTPGTGLNLNSAWWDARIDELGISHCDYGIDAAISGLAVKLSNALDDEAFDDCEPQHAALVLKLYLARLDGTLARLLQDSTVFAGDRDFEIVT